MLVLNFLLLLFAFCKSVPNEVNLHSNGGRSEAAQHKRCDAPSKRAGKGGQNGMN